MNIQFNIKTYEHNELYKIVSYIQNLDIKLPNYISLLINIRDKDDYTFLMSTSMDGDLEMTKYLIELGVDVDAKNNKGMTALMRASLYGRSNIVEYLVDNKISKADVNAINEINGKTALMYACGGSNSVSLRYLEIVECLVNSYADINVKSKKSGKTALDIAIEEENKEIENYLIWKEAKRGWEIK